MKANRPVLYLSLAALLCAAPVRAQSEVFLFNQWQELALSHDKSGRIELNVIVHVFDPRSQKAEDTQATKLTYSLEPLATEFASTASKDLAAFLKAKDPAIVAKATEKSKDKTKAPSEGALLRFYVEDNMKELWADIIRCRNFVAGETLRGYGKGIRVFKEGNAYRWNATDSGVGPYDCAEFAAQTPNGTVLQDRMFFVLKNSGAPSYPLVLQHAPLLASIPLKPIAVGAVVIIAGVIAFAVFRRRRTPGLSRNARSAPDPQVAQTALSAQGDTNTAASDSSPEGEAEELFQKGRELFAKEKFREAVQPLERAAELNPTSSQIHFILGMTYGKVAAELAYDGEKALPWISRSRTAFMSALTHASTHSGLNDKQLAVARESITEMEKLLGLDPRQPRSDLVAQSSEGRAVDSGTLAGVIRQPWNGLLARLVYVYFRQNDHNHTDTVYQSAIRAAEREISNAVIVRGVLKAGSQTTDAVGIVFPECSMRLTDWFSKYAAREVDKAIAQQGGLVRLPIDWFGQNPDTQLKTQQLSFTADAFRVVGTLRSPLAGTPTDALK